MENLLCSLAPLNFINAFFKVFLYTSYIRKRRAKHTAHIFNLILDTTQSVFNFYHFSARLHNFLKRPLPNRLRFDYSTLRFSL